MSSEEAVIYRGAESVVVKMSDGTLVKRRLRKGYRLPELDGSLNRQRQRQEVKNMKKAAHLGVRVPELLWANEERMEIGLEFLDAFVSFKDALRAQNGDNMQRIAEKVGESVASLHNGSLIHGDLTSSNIMVDATRSLCAIIDFGLSSTEGSTEAKAVDLYVFEKSLFCEAQNPALIAQILLSFLKGYGHRARDAAATLARLEKVKARGRKKISFG